MLIRAILLLALAVATAQAGLTPEQRSQLPAAASGPVDFHKDIQPIIEASCVKCHGKGRGQGGFMFETRESLLKGGDSGAAVVIGDSANSMLIEMVSGLDPDNVMPQKGKKLTSHEVALLRAWIDQGLKWEGGINFAKKAPLNLHPRKPTLPKGDGNPIDRLLESYYKANKVQKAKPVEDRLFARRAYLDVIGLLPTPEELTEFSNKSHPAFIDSCYSTNSATIKAPRFAKLNPDDKRAALVKWLLSRNNDYAQHWMTLWNDMLRNDYKGTGYIDGGRKQITSWLYSALATNMPFDRFVANLINPPPEAEGFVKGIVWRGVVNASQTPEMQAAQNVSQVFMGVNLKCASCHDSFIDDWSLADAYGLASVYAEKPLELVQCDRPLGKTAPVKFLYSELGTLDASAPKAERIRRLAEIVTSPEDGRLSRTIVNRLWERFFGRGLVEPVDEMEKPAWNQDVLDWLAADLVDHNYDLKHTIETILTSQAYQRPSVPATEASGKEFVFRGPIVRRINAEQFLDALGTVTGVWNGDAVPDLNFATVGGQKIDPTLESIAGRPRWIWSEPSAASKAPASTVYFRKQIELPAEPSEARVVVTCDNSFKLFVNGQEAGSSKDYSKPRHLDVRKFLKPGQNTIAIAATNDESAPGQTNVDQANPAGLFVYARVRTKTGAHDFGSDATWKFSNAKPPVGGGWESPTFDDSTWTFSADLGAANIGPWGLGEKLARTVANQDFAANCRAVLANADPLMTALGRPNREQVMTTRASAATTLQALELTNGSALAERIRAGAENLAATDKDLRRVSERIYLSALGRKPTSAENAVAQELILANSPADGIEDLLWAVCMLPEFQLIR